MCVRLRKDVVYEIHIISIRKVINDTKFGILCRNGTGIIIRNVERLYLKMRTIYVRKVLNRT